MALLLGLSLRSENLIFLLTAFAGFVDEFLQFTMNPQKANYLDFNDIVFNILGAGLGVAFIIAFRKRVGYEPSSYETRLRTAFVSVVALTGGIALLALAGGRMVRVLEIATNRSVIARVDGKLSFVLGFERHDSFWIKSDFGKVFHVLSPPEGCMLIALLLVLFMISFAWLRNRGEHGNHLIAVKVDEGIKK
jgi:hypothetical protein